MLTLVALLASTALWDKVEAGMSRTQVEALYPSGAKVDHQPRAIEIKDVRITDRCEAEVNIRFDDAGLVRDVMVAGNPAYGGRCARDVMALLSAKYGQPASGENTRGNILVRGGSTLIWQRDGVALRFKDFSSGGIAKSSWQLTYTPSDASFGL